MSTSVLLKQWIARRADRIPKPRRPIDPNWASVWAKEATVDLGFKVTYMQIYYHTKKYRYPARN